MELMELNERARLAAQADTADVLQKLGEPLYPWGAGFLHRDFPDVWFEKGRWVSTGTSGTYDRGNAIHFLMAYRDRSFAEAVDAVCAAAFPRSPAIPRPLPRRNPQTVLQQIRRKRTLQDLANGLDARLEPSDDAVRLPPRTREPEKADIVFDNLERVCGLHPDVCAYAAEAGKLYPCRQLAVFPGEDDLGRSCFYYLLNTRSGVGQVGKRAVSNTRYPWHLQGSEETWLHVFDTPADALRWLGRVRQQEGMDAARSRHVMAVCDRDPSPIYAYLARRIEVDRITLHLEDKEIYRQLKSTLGAVMRVEIKSDADFQAQK